MQREDRIARSIRFPAALWVAVEAAARRDNRSVNNWLETMAAEAATRGEGK